MQILKGEGNNSHTPNARSLGEFLKVTNLFDRTRPITTSQEGRNYGAKVLFSVSRLPVPSKSVADYKPVSYTHLTLPTKA